MAQTTETNSVRPNSTGWVAASHSMKTVKPSSASETPTLVNGSGELLTTARVVNLVAWLVAASEPPSKAAIQVMVGASAPNAAAARAAPAGMRITVWTVSQIVST